MQYDHPNYLILREAYKEGHSQAITCASATGGYAGSTFRTYHKAVVFGVSAICAAAGSGGTGKIVVSRTQGVAGTVSLTSYTLSNATLATNATTTLQFTSPITLLSLGDSVALHGSASAATDLADLAAVIWRFRMLPPAASTDVSDTYSDAQLG